MNGFQKKFDPQVWRVVAAIPPGRVMGYGEVAKAAGFPRYSRMVGASMGRSPEALPWHRVVRSDRSLAFEEGSTHYRQQAQLLKQEGITFDGPKIIEAETDDDLDRLLWGPVD
ncbi:MAG: methylated-DNA-protein-cysteine methyltransferase-like protein [Planctomycetota bacterium]|jgi:methylated-DNA-protein-cysteine methyltransferase-like protein